MALIELTSADTLFGKPQAGIGCLLHSGATPWLEQAMRVEIDSPRRQSGQPA